MKYAQYHLLLGNCKLKQTLGLRKLRKTQVQSQGQEDPLEKGMTTHSSMLVWRIPWTEEPGVLIPYSPWDCKELDMADCLAYTHTHTQHLLKQLRSKPLIMQTAGKYMEQEI